MSGSDVATAKDAAVVEAGLVAWDQIKWRPLAVVEKYDPEQVAYAKQFFGREPSGDMLRAVCNPYEVVASVGNLLTTAGLNRLTSLLIAGGGQGMTNTATRLGVGNSSTAEAVGQTDMQGASKYWTIMDATYPQQSNGVVTFKATMATASTDFVWAEWGTDIGTPTVASSSTVSAVMMNRKVQALGTKSGGSWVLTATITIA